MKRWSNTFAKALDAVSISYLDSLADYAKENPPIHVGMTVGVYDRENVFQAYGRVVRLDWNNFDEVHYASVMLYGGSCCSVPTPQLERVVWRASITRAVLKLITNPLTARTA